MINPPLIWMFGTAESFPYPPIRMQGVDFKWLSFESTQFTRTGAKSRVLNGLLHIFHIILYSCRNSYCDSDAMASLLRNNFGRPDEDSWVEYPRQICRFNIWANYLWIKGRRPSYLKTTRMMTPTWSQVDGTLPRIGTSKVSSISFNAYIWYFPKHDANFNGTK